MYLRLAFAVAAHLEPEILIVDEVLAVGDAAFQKKCLGKMGDVARAGRTVLFVSHNLPAVRGLCERAIWLRNGAIADDGPAASVVSHYLRAAVTSTTERVWSDPGTAPGNDVVRVRRASVKPDGGTSGEPIDVRTPFTLEFEYWNLVRGARLSLAARVFDEQGVLVFDAGPVDAGPPLEPGLYRDVCRIPGDLMNDGIYSIELRVVRMDRRTGQRLQLHGRYRWARCGPGDRRWYGLVIVRAPRRQCGATPARAAFGRGRGRLSLAQPPTGQDFPR
jgi:lipopolysaccharide transport system ATP-binding protein